MFFPRGRGEDPEGFSLVAFSDSDWAGDRESRKSMSSGMIWWGTLSHFRPCERSKCGSYIEW